MPLHGSISLGYSSSQRCTKSPESRLIQSRISCGEFKKTKDLKPGSSILLDPLITSSGFQETKNRVPRSGQNCSFYQALQQIPKRWLLVAGSLLPHSHHPERHQNENLASKETAKWKKPPPTFAHRVDDSYDSDSGILFRVHQLLSPFYFVWFRRFVRFTTIKIAPMIHGLKNSDNEVVAGAKLETGGPTLCGSEVIGSQLPPVQHERAQNTGSTVIHRMNQRQGSFQIPRLCSSHVPPMDIGRCSFQWKAAPAAGNAEDLPWRFNC